MNAPELTTLTITGDGGLWVSAVEGGRVPCGERSGRFWFAGADVLRVEVGEAA